MPSFWKYCCCGCPSIGFGATDFFENEKKKNPINSMILKCSFIMAFTTFNSLRSHSLSISLYLSLSFCLCLSPLFLSNFKQMKFFCFKFRRADVCKNYLKLSKYLGTNLGDTIVLLSSMLLRSYLLKTFKYKFVNCKPCKNQHEVSFC